MYFFYCFPTIFIYFHFYCPQNYFRCVCVCRPLRNATFFPDECFHAIHILFNQNFYIAFNINLGMTLVFFSAAVGISQPSKFIVYHSKVKQLLIFRFSISNATIECEVDFFALLTIYVCMLSHDGHGMILLVRLLATLLFL